MKYINNDQKNQITGLIAKFGINIFSNTFNADISESERKSYYEVVELIKNIIVKINEKDIPVVYYNIINNMISEFRKNKDKTDNFYIPADIWTVIYDILDISQINVPDRIDVNISISAPELSDQDWKRVLEESKEKLREVFSEYCASSESLVKPENLEKKRKEDNDSISEERFAKIVDRLFGTVHKVVLSSEILSNKVERKFPDLKISEYAEIFEL